MILSQPTRQQRSGEVVLTQLFGENLVPFYSQLGLKGHNGWDLFTGRYQDGKAPIYASHDGYVVSDKLAQSDTAGRFVRLLSDEMIIDGKPCKILTVYFHLSSARIGIQDALWSPWFWKKPEQRYVKAGILIGYGGNTGQYTTGPHLHFGLYILWKKSEGVYQSDTSNGYDGAVDPMPYMTDNTVYTKNTDTYLNGKKVAWSVAKPYLKPEYGF